MRLPEGWTEREDGRGWQCPKADASATVYYCAENPFGSVAGPNRATKEEAESDLERMVWALEGEDIAMVRVDRDKALTRADLSDKALDYARQEIAALRAEINRMEARERRRHPVVRKIEHVLYVLRGVK